MNDPRKEDSITANVIDGKAIAAKVRADVPADVARLRRSTGSCRASPWCSSARTRPSQVYVRNKAARPSKVGMHAVRPRAARGHARGSSCSTWSPSSTPIRTSTASSCSCRCRSRSTSNVIERIDPAEGRRRLPPDERRPPGARPAGLASLHAGGSSCCSRSRGSRLSGRDAVVVGRSNIVGKPMAQLLLARARTVTIAHSRTRGSAGRRAARPTCSSPRSAAGDDPRRLDQAGRGRDRRRHEPHRRGRQAVVGDVDFDDGREGAPAAITPVPGGVGPMTIACLLENTLDAALMQRGLKALAA